MKKYRILILGASYGSLLGIKLALAGHDVDLVCLPQEVELINKEGAIVRREWWQIWEHEAPPPVEYIIQSYDTAFSKKESLCRTFSEVYI